MKWNGKIDLYLPSGYLNAEGVLDTPFTFIWCVGARAVGKTYGFSLWPFLHLKAGEKFLLLRRTQTQVEAITAPGFSPFEVYNRDMGWDIGIFPVAKNLWGVYHSQPDENGKLKPSGECLGYVGALSTMANARGFDAAAIQYIYYDEFIKEPHQKAIKGEGEALLNLYETINRNRELEGKPACRLVCASNSVDLANPYFVLLGLVTKYEKMIKECKQYKALPDRSTLIMSLDNSPISQRKKETALYRMARDTQFNKMALENDFDVNFGEYQSLDLNQYNPKVCIGELTIYKHKSNGTYYVCTHKRGSPPEFGASKAERDRFRKANGIWVVNAYLGRKMRFETYYCEALLTEYLKTSG